MRKEHLKIIELLDVISDKYAKTEDEWESWVMDNRVLEACNLLKGETVYYRDFEDGPLIKGKIDRVVERMIVINGVNLDVHRVFIYHPLIFSEIMFK